VISIPVYGFLISARGAFPSSAGIANVLFPEFALPKDYLCRCGLSVTFRTPLPPCDDGSSPSSSQSSRAARASGAVVLYLCMATTTGLSSEAERGWSYCRFFFHSSVIENKREACEISRERVRGGETARSNAVTITSTPRNMTAKCVLICILDTRANAIVHSHREKSAGLQGRNIGAVLGGDGLHCLCKP
jgi:hypothetical protein